MNLELVKHVKKCQSWLTLPKLIFFFVLIQVHDFFQRWDLKVEFPEWLLNLWLKILKVLWFQRFLKCFSFWGKPLLNLHWIVFKGSVRETCPYKFRNWQYLTRILKNQFNSKQIIQILQLIIINDFSTHSYINSWYFIILFISFYIQCT